MERLKREVSWDQLVAWGEYASLEPFGGVQDDYRAGSLVAVTANANRDPKKRRKPYAASDFFPSLRDAGRLGKERKPLTSLDEGSWGAFRASMMGGVKEKRPGSKPTFWEDEPS